MSDKATERIYRHFLAGFERAAGASGARRIGAELKFPFVNADGEAVSRETVDALWAYLLERGWTPDMDTETGRVVGARKPGERNDTVASCETGYCKTEFSLAHAPDLSALRSTLDDLVAELQPFLERRAVCLLCYGIQPVTPPSGDLLMKKMRAGFWDKALPSNNVIPREQGDDVHLFTVNACSHVHVSVVPEEAVRAVNVLTALAGVQISLTANSILNGGWAEGDYKCVNEKLWDWWEPVKGRVGVPPRPFTDLRDYVARICDLKPVYVKRDGVPILLCDQYERFSDYFAERRATGRTVNGETRTVIPAMEDVAVHNSCYWYTARISRYFTVENRVFDQQPRDALLVPAALTLGLLSAADEAWEEVSSRKWESWRQTREAACRAGLDWRTDGQDAADLGGRLLRIAELGLQRRERGEEAFLDPVRRRLKQRACPADAAHAILSRGGVRALVEEAGL